MCVMFDFHINLYGIYMNQIVETIKQLAFPVNLQPHSIDSAESAYENQRVARITKIAAYALACIGTIGLIVLTAHVAIVWPVVIPVLLITSVFWAVFGRLHFLDNQYVEGVDNATRAGLVQGRVSHLLRLVQPPEVDVRSELERLNRFLRQDLLTEEFINHVIEAHQCNPDAPIVECAESQGISLEIDSNVSFTENNFFGLPAERLSYKVKWSGKATDEIEITAP